MRCDGTSVDRPGVRFVDDHRTQEGRVGSRHETHERGHIRRLGVLPCRGIDLVRGAGLARQLVAGNRDLAGRPARGEDPLEHFAQRRRGGGGDDPAPGGLGRAAPVDGGNDVRGAQHATVGDRRIGARHLDRGHELPLSDREVAHRGAGVATQREDRPAFLAGQLDPAAGAEPEAPGPRGEAAWSLEHADLDRPDVAGLGEDLGRGERLVAVFGVVVDRAIGDLDLVGHVEARGRCHQVVLERRRDRDRLERGPGFIVEAHSSVLQRLR